MHALFGVQSKPSCVSQLLTESGADQDVPPEKAASESPEREAGGPNFDLGSRFQSLEGLRNLAQDNLNEVISTSSWQDLIHDLTFGPSIYLATQTTLHKTLLQKQPLLV